MKYQKIKNSYLFIALVVLLLCFILSFSSFFSNDNSKHKMQTVLLNSKNITKIDEFELQDKNGILTLKRVDDLWLISKNLQKNITIPANISFVNSFIDFLSNQIEVYKIAELKSDNNDFGFGEESKFSIKYTLDDGTSNELIFGNMDFTKAYRYFMTTKNLSVYEISSLVDQFLSTNVQIWSDPNIIFNSVLGGISSSDIQNIIVYKENNIIPNKFNSLDANELIQNLNKLLDLRHGGLCDSRDIELIDSNLEISIVIEFANKINLKMDIYESKIHEKEYLIHSEYINSIINRKYEFYSKCSYWTYNKIIETIL